MTKSIAIRSLTLVFGISNLGCSQSDRAAADRSTDAARRAAVEKAARAIIEADNKRDLEAAVACYTDDVVWIAPGAKPVHGKAAIRSRYADMFERWQPRIELTIDNIEVAGDMALVRGYTEGFLTTELSGTVIVIDDNFLMQLRRENSDRWNISLLMWNRRLSVPEESPQAALNP